MTVLMGSNVEKLKILDLFSGIGGFSLGLERTGGFETVAFCEIDPFCQKILKKHWPEVPIYKDVRTLDYEGSVDVITGGYPCQPFSNTGKRKGSEDDRHLWPAMFDLIKKYRPSWVIGENVAGHISMGLDEVLFDLASENYRTRAFIIPACAKNAPHRRDRVWICAHSLRCGRDYGTRSGPNTGKSTKSSNKRFWMRNEPFANICSFGGKYDQWTNEPRMDRISDGVSDRMDRLRSLGNAVVPQIPEIIGHAILDAENCYDKNMLTSEKKSI